MFRSLFPAPLSPTLKVKEQEREALQKENFDLRMRLYYMDEKIKRLTAGEIYTEDDLRTELLDTQILLEEKTAELELKNALLNRARSGIDSLHAKLKIREAEAEKENNGRNALESSSVAELKVMREDANKLQQAVEAAESARAAANEELKNTESRMKRMEEEMKLEVKTLADKLSEANKMLESAR
ncbi:unnamed protein product [Chrysoparadoxa australica]